MYQEATRLGTHHSWKCAENENAIFKNLSHLQQELKDRQCMKKVKNVAIKIKNIILRCWSLVSFGHNFYDAEKITLNFALLHSDCLALTF